jgi:hypothetical protein
MPILKDLRALSRQQGSVDDIAEFTKQIQNEENARGSALLAATNADVALTQAIYQILRVNDDDKEALVKQGAPLNNFSQRITMGRILGIYSIDTEYNLDLLREIRNAFAHAHVPITFETKEVAAAIGLFRPIPLLPPYAVGAGQKAPPSDTRGRFHHHCGVVTHNLNIWGWRGTPSIREGIPEGFVAYSQPVPMA